MEVDMYEHLLASGADVRVCDQSSQCKLHTHVNETKLCLEIHFVYQMFTVICESRAASFLIELIQRRKEQQQNREKVR